MSRRLSLAGQLLALQVVIICVVLVGVAAVTVAQSTERASDDAIVRAEEVAENLAASRVVRAAFDAPGRPPSDAGVRILGNQAESARKNSGSESVVVGTADGTVLASADPSELGERPRGLWRSRWRRSWTTAATSSATSPCGVRSPPCSTGCARPPPTC